MLAGENIGPRFVVLRPTGIDIAGSVRTADGDRAWLDRRSGTNDVAVE
jgi:hypothetical protein